MQLLSINIGTRRPITKGKRTHDTGIFKTPVAEPVMITTPGIANDAIVAKKHHGGPDQAVYVYGAPDYAWWSAELGRELRPGTFGENLTISELESATLTIGDRLHVGQQVVLEVTAPRIPCATLAARVGEPTFVKRFRQGERPGVYCRVLVEGAVQAGDAVRYAPTAEPLVTVLEMFREFYEPALSAATLRRYLAAPIAIRDRTEKQRKLASLQE